MKYTNKLYADNHTFLYIQFDNFVTYTMTLFHSKSNQLLYYHSKKFDTAATTTACMAALTTEWLL